MKSQNKKPNKAPADEEVFTSAEEYIKLFENDPHGLINGQIDEELLFRISSLNSGKITVEEFKDLQKKKQQEYLLPQLAALAAAGKWREFCSIGSLHEVIETSFRLYYKDMPDEFKRGFALSCYNHHGNLVAECREAVRSLEKKGATELPAKYATQDIITVYRAAEEPIEESAFRLSWTTNFFVTRKFRNANKNVKAIYRAKIKTADVIAYISDRSEFEVVQYGSVFDVEKIE